MSHCHLEVPPSPRSIIKITHLHEEVNILKSQIADNQIKIRDLQHKNNVFRFGFGQRLLKVARAVGVEGALD